MRVVRGGEFTDSGNTSNTWRPSRDSRGRPVPRTYASLTSANTRSGVSSATMPGSAWYTPS